MENLTKREKIILADLVELAADLKADCIHECDLEVDAVMDDVLRRLDEIRRKNHRLEMEEFINGRDNPRKTATG